MRFNCPSCGCSLLYKDGLRYLSTGEGIQRFLCRGCGYRFSEPKEQIDVTNELRTSDSGLNLTEFSIHNRDFAFKEGLDKAPFSIGEDVGSHSFTDVGKVLNGLCSYNSKRQICALKKEAKNLDAATELKTVAGERIPETKGKLLQFAFYCQKEGMRESTIKTFGSSMQRLSKLANLDDPETVKEALAKMKVTENTKVSYCVAYTAFLRFLGKTWRAPKYTYNQKLPEFLPTELEIDQLIAGSGRKLSTLLQLIKETGMRVGECLGLRWTCIDAEKRIVNLAQAEKHSLPRTFKVSTTLIGMLGNLPKKEEKVFGRMARSTAENNLRLARRKIAAKIGNPRIAQIHFHLIRHWFGTMEYHKRPDMDHVRRLLGHKSILNTQLYVNMERTFFTETAEDYTVKIAADIEEAVKLLEVGFEYVTEFEGKKLFRKRK